jgi:hypothetical protein
MSSSSSSSSSGGIGFFGLLTIVFIVLKLTDVIAWSWWWVTSPLWIPTAVVLAFLAVGLVVILIKSAKEDKRLEQEVKRQRMRSIDFNG